MKLKLYQVDAFTDKVFSGNPAAVCPLESWLPDEILQNIAAENNLAETSFFVPSGGGYRLRWFTPTVEVDLCGHATLAAAYVLFNKLGFKDSQISFESRSGILKVRKDSDWLVLDFPADHYQPMIITPELRTYFTIPPQEIYKGVRDLMFVYNNRTEVQQVVPDLFKLGQLHRGGAIVTAPGDDCDFVSRFFVPALGINEDPVTGSAHTTLTPYWSKRLSKAELTARQISARGGYLKCKLNVERVEIAGQAVLYLEGEIEI